MARSPAQNVLSWGRPATPSDREGPRARLVRQVHGDAAAAAPVGGDQDGDRRATCLARAMQLAGNTQHVREWGEWSERGMLWGGTRNAERKTQGASAGMRGAAGVVPRGPWGPSAP